jgi:hypothetical protein
MDSIKEATGLRIEVLKEAVQDREKWREMVEEKTKGTHECAPNIGGGNGKPLLVNTLLPRKSVIGSPGV